MILVLLGPPGAGKGTHAVRLKETLRIPHISTGDIFRQNIKAGTPLGTKAKSFMDKGELVPDDVVVDIVKSRLLEDDCADGFLLDGFPRTVVQAEMLDAALAESGRAVDKAIDIIVLAEALIARISGRRVCKACGATYHVTNMPPQKEGVCDVCGGELYQRADDSEETVSNRIEVYNAQTKPLSAYYERAGNVARVDGEPGADRVLAAILDAAGA